MRLNLKDKNEISLYSKVLAKESSATGLSVITGIVNDEKNTTLFLNAVKEQIAQVQVLAADGKLVYNQTKTVPAGNSSLHVQVQHLPAGIYNLVVYISDGEIITKRFVK